MIIFLSIINTILAGCAIWLSYISSQEAISRWRGLKNIVGELEYLDPDTRSAYVKYFNHKDFSFFLQNPVLKFSIKNKGLAPQNITNFTDDKGFFNKRFSSRPPQKSGQIPEIMPPGTYINPRDGHSGYLPINKDNLGKFEQINGFFLENIFEKHQIISKKQIQKELDKYKSSEEYKKS